MSDAEQVAEWLRQARIARRDAATAYRHCDDDEEERLLGLALIREGAANALDPAHRHESWHTEQ